MIEYIPKYGMQLLEDVRKWGEWIKDHAAGEVSAFYPKDADGATPITYLWARTIRCEGPGCGAELPLVRSFLLGNRGSKRVGFRLEISRTTRTIKYHLTSSNEPDAFAKGTLRRGSATCPICDYTMRGAKVREQAAEAQGGANTARLLAVYCDSSKGRFYREPNQADLDAFAKARAFVDKSRKLILEDGTPVVPDEELPYLRSIFNIHLIGVARWEQMFSSRQLATLLTLTASVREVSKKFRETNPEYATALATVLALAVDRQADYSSSICTWVQSGEFVGHTFAQGQSLPIKWDFAETVPFASGSGNWEGAVGWVTRVLQEIVSAKLAAGIAEVSSATAQPLPDDSAQIVVTDPPYYDAVPYADLSDFFYVWLKRSIGTLYPKLFQQRVTQKEDEIVQLAERNPKYAFKTREYFEKLMGQALRETPNNAGIAGMMAATA